MAVTRYRYWERDGRIEREKITLRLEELDSSDIEVYFRYTQGWKLLHSTILTNTNYPPKSIFKTLLKHRIQRLREE